MDQNITIVFWSNNLSSFVWHKPLPILGYLGAEALRAKERTTPFFCRCVTVEFGWLAKPWAITASRVVLKKGSLHRKLVTAALDIRLVDNRYTWEDIKISLYAESKARSLSKV